VGAIGIGVIAIMPNDTEAYGEDSFGNMKAFAAKHGFSFPYVIAKRRMSRELMTLVARLTSSASMRETNCSIADGWTPLAYSRWQTPAVTCSRL
jgi:hypothetical protein